MSDKPKLAKRRAIRKSELLDIVLRQFGELSKTTGLTDDTYVKRATKEHLLSWLNGFGHCEYSGENLCGKPFDFDHKIPIAMQYEGDPIEWQVILRKWHKVKTKKDVADIAKAKRMSGETGQYARRMRRKAAGKSDLIKSRPSFPKAPEGHSRWPERKFGS